MTDVLIQLGGSLFGLLLLLLIGLQNGRAAERAHLRRMIEREQHVRGILVTDLREPAGYSEPLGAALLSAEVVIAMDYYKVFLAGFQKILGGELRTYTPLLDRAAREAVLCLKEQAAASGYNAVANVRLQMMTLRGTALIAYGTAYHSPQVADEPAAEAAS